VVTSVHVINNNIDRYRPDTEYICDKESLWAACDGLEQGIKNQSKIARTDASGMTKYSVKPVRPATD
jgi:hypothetical protein